MGTTLTALWVQGNRGAMIHIGDTRLYRLRRDNLRQLSEDHTVAAELARIGQLAPEAVSGHRMANVLTRCIRGEAPDEFTVLELDVQPGDRFLLSTDGFHHYLRDDRELIALIANGAPDAIPQCLVRFANRRGGADNITALLVDVDHDVDTLPRAASAAWHEAVELQLATALC